MIKNTISLCMIVKDEEKNIGRCLKSVVNIVDEIIVVDTGSTDRTIEIAKEYGAKIYHHPWNNDFSDARNASLEKATKDWILFLDADEEMLEDEGEKLKNAVSFNPNLDALHFRLVNIISNMDIGDAIVLRAFRNKPEYRFEGKMHEQVIGCIEKNGGKTGASDIQIRHYGYDPQYADINQKQKRNIDLLNSYPESKRDGYFYYSLGNEYARINENDKALDYYQKALDIPIKKGERPVYVAYLYLHISKVLNSSKKYIEEVQRLNKFEKHYKDFKDLYFMECLAHIECNKISKAKEALEKYINCPQGSYEYPSSNFEKHYNINELLQNLSNSSINQEEKTLSSLILCTEDNPLLVETLKSVNEISYEVIIATSKNSNLNREPLENIGATIVDIKNDDNKNIFMKGYSQCKGKYILLLKPNEVCSLDSQYKIAEFLKNTDDKYFNLIIGDLKTRTTSNEFRLFENDKALKKIKHFDDLAKYIHSNEIKDTGIYLHKK
ncbi:MAG: glycosyltransferase [Terrisporobacter sp.]|uniref:glycosyltransferase n=1 Tax=Terrisporobacter sp. TaxID=1965305 RepID=UPI002FCA0E70